MHDTAGLISRNIAATLPERAQAAPDCVAVHEPRGFRRGAQTRYRSISFRQLDERSQEVATALQTAGIRAGTRVAVMVPPSIDFFATTFALFRLGAIPVFIDPGMGIKSLARCLDEAAPEAFIGTAKAHLARLIFGWRRGLWRWKFHLHDVRWLPQLTALQVSSARRRRAASRMPAPVPMHQAAEGETAAILFTSGSTGAPKGAVYQHRHFLTQIELMRTVFGIKPGEHDLCTFPLFALFAPALGMISVIPRMDFTRPAAVDPREIFAPIARFGVTNLFASPALLRRVAHYGQTHRLTLRSLQRVLSAGAPVPAATLANFRTLLAEDANIFTPYGATEALPVAVIESREVLAETAALTGVGRGICVGRPVPGTMIRIMCISEASFSQWTPGLSAAPGKIGEIVVSGPQVTAAYDGRPEATAAAKMRDPDSGASMHRMGDLGYLDSEGRLWFCGRKSHRVETAAAELYTIPCEAIFNLHPRVHRSALVGKGARGAMEPVLCVELETHRDARARRRIREELLKLGAAHAMTQSVREIRFFDVLPVDTRHNAKIFRERLKRIVDATPEPGL